MNNMEINQPAADFELSDIYGRIHRLRDYHGSIVILNFWSCECPHSQRTDKAILSMMAQWRGDVMLLCIAANRNENAGVIKTVADARHLQTVLLDPQCTVADHYQAQTTPHVFVIDRGGILRYRGAVDNATFRQRTPTRFFLDEAVESLLEDRLPALSESPAYGCTIVREV
jgi:peroxiredoxin